MRFYRFGRWLNLFAAAIWTGVWVMTTSLGRPDGVAAMLALCFFFLSWVCAVMEDPK